jgi:SAM-dependent methyltransferase
MYDRLAPVYDFLVSDEQLTPVGCVRALTQCVELPRPGARILDCAAGTGRLAVGLAMGGYRVVASDSSPAMTARARGLAQELSVPLDVVTCQWSDLRSQTQGEFDCVLCTGNSISHAPGVAGRREALSAMASILRSGGVLVLSFLDWEAMRPAEVTVTIGNRVLVRDGQKGLLVQTWVPSGEADLPDHLLIAVAAFREEGRVESQGERLDVWPFTPAQLRDDLDAAGLKVEHTEPTADGGGYWLTAQRS